MATKKKAEPERPHYLAEWLEELSTRDEDPINAAIVARRIGVTRGTVSKWADGSLQVDIRKLRKLATAMGLRPDALLYHPEDGSPAARVARMNPEILGHMLKRDLGR